MIHEKKIRDSIKSFEFKANLFTYFLDNSPEIDRREKVDCTDLSWLRLSDGTSDESRSSCCRFLAMGYHAAILRYSVAPARFPGGASSAGYSSCNAP